MSPGRLFTLHDASSTGDVHAALQKVKPQSADRYEQRRAGGERNRRRAVASRLQSAVNGHRAAIATLDRVMRVAGKNCTGETGHDPESAQLSSSITVTQLLHCHVIKHGRPLT